MRVRDTAKSVAPSELVRAARSIAHARPHASSASGVPGITRPTRTPVVAFKSSRRFKGTNSFMGEGETAHEIDSKVRFPRCAPGLNSGERDVRCRHLYCQVSWSASRDRSRRVAKKNGQAAMSFGFRGGYTQWKPVKG